MVNREERVFVRDRPWRVQAATPVAGEREALDLLALDGDLPARLQILSPPDTVTPLSSGSLQLHRRAIDSCATWTRLHRMISATAIRETGLISGARWGRVRVEAYQLAPALRLISKPRPSLLVADDVGLGKTIEAGLGMLELMSRGRAKRILVVAPPGLVLQWRDELLEKFGLAFSLIENAAGLARAQTQLPAGVSPWDALPRVLSSVDYLKRETVRSRALRKRWDLIVVDEAHSLAESGTPTNPYRTQRTRLGLALRESAAGLVLLTATPHNGYAHSFRSLIELVEPARATLAGDRQAIRKRVDAAMVRRMKAQIRRRREDGTEETVFPPRHVDGVPVRPTEPRYSAVLRKVSSYCSRTLKEAGGAEDEDLVGFAMQIVKKRALSSRIAFEKTIASRLEALKKESAREAPPERAELREMQADLPLGEARAERTAQRVLRSAIPKEERRRKAEVRALNAIRKDLKAIPPGDPKIKALLTELHSVFANEPDERFIVFTEYLDTLESLRAAFDADESLAGRYVVLRGGLSARQRRARQTAFEKSDTRILLATDAASEGLNLQRLCRRIIHFELPWNPNRLEQRNGRVDRYCQTRDPQIRYLFFPDSAEEDVLHQLVRKIEAMARDRVSTPDILGVLAGADEAHRGLTGLDAESADVEQRKAALVRLFDDRTRDFIRDVQPVLASADPEQRDLSAMLDAAEPLLGDDSDLESIVLGLLGPGAVEPAPVDGVYSLRVPLAYRGPEVRPVYSAATFRRDVAVAHPTEEVEYLTPLHPLVKEIAEDARRRLFHAAGNLGLEPRRLAARRVDDAAPSIVFTFLGELQGGGGLREEHVLPVRIALDDKILGNARENASFLREEGGSGEVPFEELEERFAARFDDLQSNAMAEALRLLAARAAELRARRAEQSAHLRADLDRDLADRLREIEEEERRARGMLDESTGQALLFAERERSSISAATRRAAAESQAAERRVELDDYARVDDPAGVHPLGALFLVPEGAGS